MVISNSYVKLPEGTPIVGRLKHMFHIQENIPFYNHMKTHKWRT